MPSDFSQGEYVRCTSISRSEEVLCVYISVLLCLIIKKHTFRVESLWSNIVVYIKYSACMK